MFPTTSRSRSVTRLVVSEFLQQFANSVNGRVLCEWAGQWGKGCQFSIRREMARREGPMMRWERTRRNWR